MLDDRFKRQYWTCPRFRSPLTIPPAIEGEGALTEIAQEASKPTAFGISNVLCPHWLLSRDIISLTLRPEIDGDLLVILL